MTSHTIIGTRNVLVFGSNNYNQLGFIDPITNLYGVMEPQYLMENKDIIQIICHNEFTIILKEHGEILVFGSNRYGQLGLSSSRIRVPTPLLVINKHVIQIACGDMHTLILTLDGQVFSFGSNKYGQLGLDHNCNNKYPELYNHKYYQKINQTKTSKFIIKIACGGFHSIIVANNYEIFVFGRNDAGQLGLDHNGVQYSPTLLMKNENINKIICGWGHTIMLNDNGQVFVFGYYNFCLRSNERQTTPHPLAIMSDKNIVQVACDQDCAVFLADNGEVWRVGYMYEPKLLITDNAIVQITCGENHTIILKNNGQILVVGSNDCGQLGLGNVKKQNVPQLLMDGVTIMFNTVDLLKWIPAHHRYFSYRFREKIWVFLLALKRFQFVTGIYVPKFVRFEIVKKCV